MNEPARAAWRMTRTAWLAVAAFAFWAVLVSVTWPFLGTLRDSLVGQAVLLLVFAPPALALYLLLACISEGGAMLLLWLPFKLVTLFRVPTEFSEPRLKFRWGFARNARGQWVASENAMALVSLALYAAVGAVWYLVAWA